MNFKSWAEKYYPNENKNVLHKMSHAWAAGHTNMAASQPRVETGRVGPWAGEDYYRNEDGSVSYC